MTWLSDMISILLSVGKKILPANAAITIGGATVTAAQLETATGSLGVFFTAFYSAIKAKNIETSVELTVDEAVTVAADLGFGEPFTGLAKTILPLIFGSFNQIAAERLTALDGGEGGFLTQAWIEDPRHQLDANGNFKNDGGGP